LVAKVARVYCQSIAFFRNDERQTLSVIGSQLPALRDRPEVVAKCYRLFAPLFESSLTPSVASLRSVLAEIARQDARANELDASSLIERVI